MKQSLSLSRKITNFESNILEKRLLDAWFLTVWNSRKIQSRVKDRAVVDARGCYASPYFACLETNGEILRLISSVRVSPLPSYSTRQSEKPQAVGRWRESDPTLSLFIDYGRGGVCMA